MEASDRAAARGYIQAVETGMVHVLTPSPLARSTKAFVRQKQVHAACDAANGFHSNRCRDAIRLAADAVDQDADENMLKVNTVGNI